MNRWHRLQLAGASVASGLLLLALTVGVPILLIGLHGRPDDTSSYQGLVGLLAGRVTPAGILDGVAAAGWIAWLVVAIAVLVEVSAWTRGRPTPPIGFAAPIQPWVRHLVATTALIASTFAPTLRTAGAVPIPAHVPAVASPVAADIVDRTVSIAAPVTVQPAGSVVSVPSRAPTCTVVPRDTLWGLAETHLRDPLRWREIFTLNQGITQGDGRRLDDPDLILPGWILHLPADADVPAPTINPPDTASAPTSPAKTPPPASATAEDAHSENPAPAVAPVEPTTAPTTRHTTGRTPPEAADSRARQAGARAGDASEPVDLPVAAVAAAGLISLLTVVRLARRRRRQPPAPASPAARRVEAQLRDLADTPTQERVRMALRALTPALSDSGARVLAVRLRHDERVEVLLDAPLTQTPAGFEPSDDPRGWITRADFIAPPASAPVATPAPCTVTIGAIDGETVLIDLETARLLTIGGDPTAVIDWLRHAQVELATATPDDLVQVILIDDEPADPVIDGHPRLERLTMGEALDDLDARNGSESTGDACVTVLVCMCGLDDAARDRLEAIVTDRSRRVVAIVPSIEPATWHAQIEPNGLRLAPLGLVLDPCRLDADTTAAITELLAPPDASFTDPPQPDEAHEPEVLAVTDAEWDLEIRVLGPVEVVGAARPFDRHKHLEIAVYLGLYPDGVSDERLKTALWPDRAPSTTTFNTAISTTRHRLGRDPAGDVFLSHYAAAGRRYRLNPRAGSDWARFQAHVARARHADREVKIDELRAALDLVRGQPFAEAYGFGWAWSEGHVASMEAAIADAAHRLAGAYLDQNEPDQAIWAAMRGLQAAPADEVLYRDRMLAYDLAGNPAGIATVMLELEHVVESIEPWDSIHPETIALYHRLTRSSAAGNRHRSRAPRRAD